MPRAAPGIGSSTDAHPGLRRMYGAGARVYVQGGGEAAHRRDCTREAMGGGTGMSMIRFEPFRWEFDDLGVLRRSMDKMFDELLLHNPRAAEPPKQWKPAVEMFETDAEVVVRAELPSIDPKNVDITVTEDTITLRGETKHEEEQKNRNYFYRELMYGTFIRTLKLPTPVKGTEAKAVYKDGVLEVKIPKAAQFKPIPIKVQTAA
jgi:HSP20 family protein